VGIKKYCWTDIKAEKMLYIKLKKEGLIMKKRIVAMMMALMMAVGLAGCGGSNDAADNSASSTTNAGTGVASAAGENLTVSLSNVIHADEYSIWYSASAVDKDKKPEIYVLYNDGTYINGNTEYTFKELSEMTDEDIVSCVQSSWNAKKDSAAANANQEEAADIVKEKGYRYYEEYYYASDESSKDRSVYSIVGGMLFTIGEYMDEFGYWDYSEGYSDYFEGEEEMLNDNESWLNGFWLSVYQSNRDEIWTWYINGEPQEDDFYESIKEQYLTAASEACDSELAALASEVSYDGGTYTIHATTDSTGNNVQSESIALSEGGGNSITGLQQPQAILESYYGGYTLSNGDVFVVRTSDDVTFSLDTKDTEGIEVD
jgi:hypothetical protein